MHWAVILAGGDGTRLRPLTRALTGDDRPKQFCPLLGDKTLLAETRARVALNIEAGRSICVVTRAHERFYRRELADMPARQLIEQPVNRGTTAAIAYAIARIARQDRKARVALFPADHYYEDAETFRHAVDAGLAAAVERPDLVFLLGTEPTTPEVEYGWIEPGLSLPYVGRSISMVRRFWEKPPRPVAQDLFERGCLWNMFVMIGGIGAFRRLLWSSVPDLVSTFELLEGYPAVPGSSVDDIYAGLQPVDFSTVVLSRHTQMMAVLRVPQIGWTDLGHPSRVRSLLRSHGHASAIGVAS